MNDIFGEHPTDLGSTEDRQYLLVYQVLSAIHCKAFSYANTGYYLHISYLMHKVWCDMGFDKIREVLLHVLCNKIDKITPLLD